MAAHFNAWIYGEVTGVDPDAVSRALAYSASRVGIRSFPAVGTVFHPISPVVSVGGVNCNAIIEVIPTGLNLHGRKYCTTSDVSTLNTAAG